MIVPILLLLALVFLVANIAGKLPLWPAALTFALFVLAIIAPRFLPTLR